MATRRNSRGPQTKLCKSHADEFVPPLREGWDMQPRISWHILIQGVWKELEADLAKATANSERQHCLMRGEQLLTSTLTKGKSGKPRRPVIGSR